MESRGYVTHGRFKTGSIYTILNRMENKGLLISKHKESESGRTRRVYSITHQGTEILRRGLKNIQRRKKIMDKLTKFYYDNFTK
jgi:DNA-binding PadR family transcriptional regulator